MTSWIEFTIHWSRSGVGWSSRPRARSTHGRPAGPGSGSSHAGASPRGRPVLTQSALRSESWVEDGAFPRRRQWPDRVVSPLRGTRPRHHAQADSRAARERWKWARAASLRPKRSSSVAPAARAAWMRSHWGKSSSVVTLRSTSRFLRQ